MATNTEKFFTYNVEYRNAAGILNFKKIDIMAVNGHYARMSIAGYFKGTGTKLISIKKA